MNRLRVRRRAAIAGTWLPLAVAVALACPAGRDADEPLAGSAPPSPQATVVIEPPQLRVGDVAEIEVAVVTPPHYAVRPVALPDASALGPVWVLGVEARPVDQRGPRCTHRTRIRVRARDVGTGTWPALTIELVGPENATATLTTEPRSFEVVSVLPGFPDRLTPFPLRLPATRSGLSPWLAAAGGAVAALAVVGALALVQRQRRRRDGLDPRGGDEASPEAAASWTAAVADLSAAAAASDTDWRQAADAVAVTLRRYAAQRWGFAIESRTTEELAALPPPFALSWRWPTALAWLRELDALRFRADAGSDAPDRVRHIAEAATRWVEATNPSQTPR